MWSSNFISGYVAQRIESRNLKRYVYTQVHRSMIHINQKLEANHMSMDRGMDKQNVVYMYSGVLFSLNMEGDYICCNTDEPEDIMLSGISQTQKEKYCMIALLWGT